MARLPRTQPLSAGGEGVVRRAWERFLSGDGVPRDAVRRMVEDSWRRCLDHGVDPIRRAAPLAVSDEEIHGLLNRQADLVEAARPVMAQAREFLSESGTMMILTDPQGVILSVEGDPAAKDHGRSVHLMPGALWTEGVSGTNAIGTALASGKPAQICAAEHFCEGIKQWTCSASIIRDPYDGTVVGVLDVSGLSGHHNSHCLALVVTGAGRIETRLAALEMEKRTRLLDVTLSGPRRWGDGGLVVFDRRGRMVRANEGASLFLETIGLDLGVCGALRLPPDGGADGLDGRTLPDWLRPDWIEPVIDRDERLGTVLALPMSGPSVRIAAAPRETAKETANIVGHSAVMEQVKSRALQLAKLTVPTLLLGPTGSGKEVLARALHDAGPQAKGPFVPLNCGCMTRDLLASELFGYAEGAFTGARRGGMVGKFEAADGGTLFLDEIGEMPLDLQAHLLRVLEDGAVYRLGENRPRKVRVRVVAATNRDLRAEVAEGRFRMDLYYRLAVTVLRLPRLDERREDIPLLVQHFLDQGMRRFGTARKLPTHDLMDLLTAHSWLGNVRELRNVVEGMLLLSQSDTLTRADLPPDFVVPAARPAVAAAPAPSRRPADERAALFAAIAAEDGNLTRTARRLGIAKSTLYEKLKRHGIDRGAIETLGSAD